MLLSGRNNRHPSSLVYNVHLFKLPVLQKSKLASIITISCIFYQNFVVDFPEPKPAMPDNSVQHRIAEKPWQKIDEGLETAEFNSPQKSFIGDSRITVIRINPDRYAFKLIAASENNKQHKTAPEWYKDKKLLACVNAGQFNLDDQLSNMGYMKNYSHVNNPNFRKINNYNSILAFNRKDTSVAPIQIIDLKCQDWAQLQTKYHSFTQSISLITCNKQIVDNKQKGKWSMVLFGMDEKGNVLWIFTRSPYTIRQFSEILLSLPLAIQQVMYLEGGPETSLYLETNGKKIAKMGSYETGFWESDANQQYWPLPNVIGIVKK